MVDSKGILGKHREDIEAKKDKYAEKWHLCQTTNNEGRQGEIKEAMDEHNEDTKEQQCNVGIGDHHGWDFWNAGIYDN